MRAKLNELKRIKTNYKEKFEVEKTSWHCLLLLSSN